MVVLTGVADITYYVLILVLAMCKGKVLNLFKVLELPQLNYFTKRKRGCNKFTVEVSRS